MANPDMRHVDVFVAPTGNAFMRDIAQWVVEAARLDGRTADLRADGSAPTDPRRINLVVAPHEFYLLSEFDDATIHRAVACSVPVCTEQPGTPWFDIGLTTAMGSEVVLDINRHGVEALLEAGVDDVRHLRLGGVPSMVAPTVERDLDLVLLAGDTTERGRKLAGLAPLLWERHVDLRLFSFFRPVLDGAPGLVFGREKYELLARSGILLNLHRDDQRPGYFEWARMVESMANGCCVVTEPVAGSEPFVDGVHFVETDDLETTLSELLDDPARTREIGERGRRAVLDEHPLVDSLAPILADLDRRAPRAVPSSRRVPRYRRRMIVAQQHPVLPAFAPAQEARARIYHALMAETRLQRRIERLRSKLRHGVDDHVERFESTSYEAATPRVSVIVTLYDYAHVVLETLDSLASSTGVAFEIVVVDDHSTDDGRAVVAEFAERHPEIPLLLLGSDINRGLPAARNFGFEHARGELMMVMDADNLVYPNALARLAATLDEHPDAAFAYCTLEQFGTEPGVRSAMAWNVERLCDANYIDAQAMLRRSTWERYGGYRTDDELVFGWEDWELWLRLAAAGEHGVHLAQMLGRYRTQEQSMLSTTNLVAGEMRRHLRELHPGLPWPA
ncbi:MAG: glycosyltransferase [Ilumatobacter sp.]|nr:glycosyltransferase [Ilumatobacter sp.]